MSIDNKYDVIIIGAGMGGLSSAAFLAKEGKRVLVIEKHNKPGGFITSFTRNDCRFDIGLEGFSELAEGETIAQFLKYWGANVKTVKRSENIRVFTGNEDYVFHSNNLQGDFIRQFPHELEAIIEFFDINNKITTEMYSGGSPEDISEMNIIEKILFGVKTKIQKPTLMKYGIKNAYTILDRIFNDKNIMNVILAKGICDMVYLGHVYRWEVVRNDCVYYPIGGMQAIPDAIVESIKANNGHVLLNKEVQKILISNGIVEGVECNDGSVFYSDIVISNSSIHHTVNKLARNSKELDPIRKKLSTKSIFPGGMLNFMGVDKNYDFGGINYISIIEENTIDMDFDNFTPENCPIWIIISEQPEGQENYSVVVMAHIPYSYQNNWETGDTHKRNEKYRMLKNNVNDIIIDRICAKLGENFRKAILFCIPSTPLTSERYTYSTEGAFMGWSMKADHYGKFFPQTTPIKNLFLVGQWVFPSPGVMGVMAGGYYLSKNILKRYNIDLESRFKEYFEKN